MEKSLVQQHGCSWREAKEVLTHIKMQMGYSRSIQLTSLPENVQQSIRDGASALISSRIAEEAQERNAMEQSIQAVEEQLRRGQQQIQDNALVLLSDCENLSYDLRSLPPMLQDHNVDRAKWILIYNLVQDMKVVIKQARFLERQMLTHLRAWKNDTQTPIQGGSHKLHAKAIEHIAVYDQIVSNCNLVANNALTVANMILAPHGLYAQLAIEKTRWMASHRLPHLRIASMRPIGLQFHPYGMVGVAAPTSLVEVPATAEIQMADVIAVTAPDGAVIED